MESENKVEIVDIDSLKNHPQNYRIHPSDELAHIIESLKTHGVYRNVVTARDGTLLAGHGVVMAARQIGLKQIPIVRLDIDPTDPKAIKVLIGDNEMEHLSQQNDRLLAELLKQIKDQDGLLGTGFDEMMLANFVMVTRPESEIKDFDAAAEWVGMPEYDSEGAEKFRLVIGFLTEQDRQRFADEIKLRIDSKGVKVWSTRWPWTDRNDKSSVKFE
jgi:hypothetical protein